ncbi:MAG: aminodeoxychorismate synthase component I [Candidatus Omnitrophota bacterium]
MSYNLPLNTVFNYLTTQKNYVLLESSLQDKENFFSYIFRCPQQIITCHTPGQIKDCFNKIQKAVHQGYYVAGFVSYEAGFALIDKLEKYQKNNYDFPLIWMGVFDAPITFNHYTNKFLPKINTLQSNHLSGKFGNKYIIKNKHLNITRNQYFKDIKSIKKCIESGDTYQVNHTLKYKFDFHGNPFALYQDLRKKQPVNYSAFINSPEFTVLSFSPELFFKLKGENIHVKPMKGTAPRGLNPELDRQYKINLGMDLKNRAENIMIVDLLRNDLGKISKTGSVKVTDLFRVEKYTTLFQMTSTIKSKIKNNLSLFALFSSLFPSGSVTGAPKIHTMEIIKVLEPEDRKIYTGSIGFFSPKKKGVFNIAIRTIILEKNKGEMGIGSGITYNSKSNLEFQECLLKAEFLKPKHFQLIETMLLDKKTNISFLNEHLKRMRLSAKFFGIPFIKTKIVNGLTQPLAALNKNSACKIRMLLDVNGDFKIQTTPITSSNLKERQKIIISKIRINPNNPFLYHKTTKRKIYDKEFKKYSQLGVFDVIFLNNKNEITEGAISNIFVKKNNLYYTPPVSCGLLPGVYRKYFIKKHPKKVKEKILNLNDLKNADNIYCTNSVRGMVEVVLKTG